MGNLLPGEGEVKSGTGNSSRIALFDWLLPGLHLGACALKCGRPGGGTYPGWVYDRDAGIQPPSMRMLSVTPPEAARAAWRQGSLPSLALRGWGTDKATGKRKVYDLVSPRWMGATLWRDGKVCRACIDIDRHEVDDDGLDIDAEADRIDEWMGVVGWRWTSGGGKGRHAFYGIPEMAIAGFDAWSDGTEATGAMPEIFPKSDALTNLWLPSEPNEKGGDRWLKGGPSTCAVARKSVV